MGGRGRQRQGWGSSRRVDTFLAAPMVITWQAFKSPEPLNFNGQHRVGSWGRASLGPGTLGVSLRAAMKLSWIMCAGQKYPESSSRPKAGWATRTLFGYGYVNVYGRVWCQMAILTIALAAIKLTRPMHTHTHTARQLHTHTHTHALNWRVNWGKLRHFLLLFCFPFFLCCLRQRQLNGFMWKFICLIAFFRSAPKSML